MINSSRLPDDSVNISKQNPLLLLFKLLFALLAIIFTAMIFMDIIIEKSVDLLTPEQERALTKRLFVNSEIPARDNAYLNRVTKKLLKCSKLNFTPKTYAVNSMKINAFAMPNGNIYITKGMLKKIKNENELAFVIAHELGHFKHRDHLKGFGASVVGAIFSMLLTGNSSLASSVDFTQLKYSQLSEKSADIFGLKVMLCSYGTTLGAKELFARIDNKEFSDFLSTHPSFENRIKLIDSWNLKHNIDLNREPIPLEDNISAIFTIYIKKKKKTHKDSNTTQKVEK